MKKNGTSSDYTDARVRFFAICNMLSNARPKGNHPGIPTAEEISRKMNVPLSVIRKDIYNIITSKYLFRVAYAIGLSDCDPLSRLNDEFKNDDFAYKQIFSNDDKKSILENFKDGKYDQIYFYLNLFNNDSFDIDRFLWDPQDNDDACIEEFDSDGIIDTQGHIVLFLNRSDKDVMNRFMSGLKSDDRQDLMNIKSINYLFTQDYVEQLQILQEAIAHHKVVYINYSFSSKIEFNLPIQPICLLFNYYDQMIHVLCNDGKKYNIKRIRKASIHNETFVPSKKPSFLDDLWASGYGKDEKPIEIKLKITESTSNLINKFISDTANRKHGHFDPETGIYTDTILGEAGFRRWLRKYGASIVVLEPRELAAKMYASARDLYNVYEAEQPDLCRKLSSNMHFDPAESSNLYEEYLKNQTDG